MKNTLWHNHYGIAPRTAKRRSRNILYGSAVLLLCLAVLPYPGLAHNPVRGQSTAVNIVLNRFQLWSTILQVDINVPAGEPTHNCAVIASADVINPGGDGENQRYRFGLSQDAAIANNTTVRNIEVRRQRFPDVNDPDRWPVSTNRTFPVGPGNHTFFFLGGPAVADGSHPNIRLDSAALSVICSHDINR